MIIEKTAEAENRIDPDQGVMFQIVWFDAGANSPGFLLVTLHYLVVDEVSWRILIEDLAIACQAVKTGRTPRFASDSTSFSHWAKLLSDDVQSPARRAELPFWQKILKVRDPLLSKRPLDPVLDLEGTTKEFTLKLPSEITTILLTELPELFHAEVNDILQTAFTLVVTDWRCRRGCGKNAVLRFDFESNGREEINGVTLSRTVGRFTNLYPVRLNPGKLKDLTAALADEHFLARSLKRIKEQRRAIPGHGLGYGLLRHFNSETKEKLASYSPSQICFNYQGQFDISATEDWSIIGEPTVFCSSIDPSEPSAYAITLRAITFKYEKDEFELIANWSWAGLLFEKEDISMLAKNWFEVLRALTRLIKKPSFGGLTPSDLCLVSLNQNEIEQLETIYHDIENVLPLVPLQQGLLLHDTYNETNVDAYMGQMIFDLEGVLNIDALKAATQALINRHSNLRACFVYQGLETPVQVIPRQVAVRWQVHDLTTLTREAQESRLLDILARDSTQRFDLAQPPMIRFMLICLSDQRYQLVLTDHHILLDGWSMPILLNELFELYRSNGDVSALPDVVPYRNYVAWFAKQDQSAAEAAWTQYLADLKMPTRLAQTPLSSHVLPETFCRVLSVSQTDALNHQANQLCLTLNTLLQCAWGLLLAKITERNDVVFGITVSERPAEVAGVEDIIGLLINTIPLRMQINPVESLSALLARIQEAQWNLIEHVHLGLLDIQRICGLGDLFDTYYVFQNYPIASSRIDTNIKALNITQREEAGIGVSHYPLGITVLPDKRLKLLFGYHPELFDRPKIEKIGEHLVWILETMIQDTEQQVSTLLNCYAFNAKEIAELILLRDS